MTWRHEPLLIESTDDQERPARPARGSRCSLGCGDRVSIPPPASTGTTPEDVQGPTSATDLGRQAARGALLTVSAQMIKIVLQVGGVVVLARLLTPGDYGLVAMVATVVGFAEIFRDFGLSAAAVQAKHLSRGQRDNLFWANTAAGAVLAGAMALAAPLIAAWYHRPELVDLARVMSLVFLLNGMAAQYRAGLIRDLRFSKIAVIDVAAPLIALATGVGLAASGVGYWALVAQQLTAATVLLLGAVLTARWCPRLPRRHEPMGDLFRFGWHLASAQFVGYVGNNVDSVIIGYRFGPSPLGLYNRAFQLLMTPLGQLRQPTTTVALPVLSQLKDDVVSSNRYVQRGQLALGLTLVAGLALVVGAARPVTAIFLGEQWLEVEPILRLLAAAGIFQTLAFVGYWVYLAHGLTKQLFRYTLVVVPIKIICVGVGSYWGIEGVAWGYAISHGLEWPISFVWLSRSSTISVRGLYLGACRILGVVVALSASSYAACAVVQDRSAWVQLGAAILAALVAYALLVTLPPLRRDVAGVLEIVRTAIRRRAR